MKKNLAKNNGIKLASQSPYPMNEQRSECFSFNMKENLRSNINENLISHLCLLMLLFSDYTL